MGYCICKMRSVCVHVSRCGVKTVINLQRPGEHASCGNPLEPESGFSYRPEIFMEKGSTSNTFHPLEGILSGNINVDLNRRLQERVTENNICTSLFSFI